MTYIEQINHEENINREDILLESSLTGRINAARRALRNGQSLAADELYQLLGDCALLMSDQAWARHENEARLVVAGHMLRQLSFAEVPVSPMADAPAAVMALPAPARGGEMAAD
jgi:hypothetical protein